MPEFDRDKVLALRNAQLKVSGWDAVEGIERCLNEIDRLNTLMEEWTQAWSRAAKEDEQRGYRRGVEAAAVLGPELTDVEKPSLHFIEGYEWGVESMQNAIRALIDAPEEDEDA